jgi:hypothetical protein
LVQGEKYHGEKACDRRHDDDDHDDNKDDDDDTKNEGIQHINAKLGASLKKKWESKVLHGQYIRSTERQLVSEEVTLLRLSRGELKGETESELITAQDLVLQAKHRSTKILQQVANVDCKQFDETVEHIISPCPVLATEQGIKRHVRVCAELHCNICREIGGKLDHKQLYDRVPKLVQTGHEGMVAILWNEQCRPTELFLTINRTV